jgi:hypothetical protein
MKFRSTNQTANSLRNLMVLLAGTLAVLAPCASASTYWVSTSGSDSNPGSQSAPFRHVSKGAAAAANPGDTVMVMDGTYDNEGVTYGNFVVTLQHSGSSSNPITFQAQHTGMAILDGGSGAPTNNSYCNGASSYFNLYDASFIVIQGFIIQHNCDSGIQSNDYAHDIVIRQNEIRNIANWYITDQIGRDGIYLNNNEYNFRFDSNSFHDIGRTGGNTRHFDHGIYSHAATLTIINNLFFNMNAGWSIQMADGASNYLIANNTFAFPNTGDGEAGQIMWWGANTNITLRNNIFYYPTSYAMSQYQATISGCVIDHNLIYPITSIMTNTNGCSVTGNLTGSAPNPLFVNTQTAPYNFYTQQGGAGIDAGVNLSPVPYDYVGTARPQGTSTDIGAYEYMSGGGGGGGNGGGDITTGLTGWWKFNEGSGSYAYDYSGNSSNAGLQNPTWWNSNYGETCWFDGTKSFGTIAEAPNLEMTTALTVAFWARPSQNSQTDPRVISKLYDWDVKLSGGNRYPQFSSSGQYAVLNYSFPLTAWHHIVFTFSSGVVTGYVDGAPVALSTNTFRATNLPNWAFGFYIGAYDGNGDNPYIGSVDDIRVYKRALSANDVLTLYQYLPKLN